MIKNKMSARSERRSWNFHRCMCVGRTVRQVARRLRRRRQRRPEICSANKVPESLFRCIAILIAFSPTLPSQIHSQDSFFEMRRKNVRYFSARYMNRAIVLPRTSRKDIIENISKKIVRPGRTLQKKKKK